MDAVSAGFAAAEIVGGNVLDRNPHGEGELAGIM